jgi:hypothetical protein
MMAKINSAAAAAIPNIARLLRDVDLSEIKQPAK